MVGEWMVGVGAWMNGGVGGMGRWISVCLDGSLDG